MSYRPKIKKTVSGVVTKVDLPLDAETIKGYDIIEIVGSQPKIKNTYLPAIAITDTFVCNAKSEMLALSAQKGDVCIRTDEHKTYILQNEPATTEANWVVLEAPGLVTSVNAQGASGSHISVSDGPITTSGTLTIGIDNGYSIPSDTKQGQWDAKYDKPNTGIPKNHLAQGVQDSLDAADSALQEVDLDGYATQEWVTNQGYTTNIGTVTKVKLGDTGYDPINGIISLPAYPDTITDATVASWGYIKTSAVTSVCGHTGAVNLDADDVGITVTSTSVSDGTTTFNKYTHPTYVTQTAGLYKIGRDATGHVVIGDAFTIPAEVTENTVSGWGFIYEDDIETYLDENYSMGASDFAAWQRDIDDTAGHAYQKPPGGIPANDLAETYLKTTDISAWAKEATKPNYTASEVGAYPDTNPNGYTTNTGTVTSVQVQAGTGLVSSQNTAQTSTLSTTISIDSNYKLPTATEWNSKADKSTFGFVDLGTIDWNQSHSLTSAQYTEISKDYAIIKCNNIYYYKYGSANNYIYFVPSTELGTRGEVGVTGFKFFEASIRISSDRSYNKYEVDISEWLLTKADIAEAYQPLLVSGTNLKTINNTSLLGSGNIDITVITETTVSGWGFTKNVGTVTSVNATSPDANGNVTITIPAEVTSTTVSNWGFTKNAGTITGITMNGSSKGTSGVIDLGTVITSHLFGYVDLGSSTSGTLSASQYAEISKDYAIIKCNGVYYGSFGEDDTRIAFISCVLGTRGTIMPSVTTYLTNTTLLVNKTTKAYSLSTIDVQLKTINGISILGSGDISVEGVGTVTSVRVQAGTGLTSSTSTAQTSTLDTTISIASGYKLPTTAEWNSKANSSDIGNGRITIKRNGDDTGTYFNLNSSTDKTINLNIPEPGQYFPYRLSLRKNNGEGTGEIAMQLLLASGIGNYDSGDSITLDDALDALNSLGPRIVNVVERTWHYDTNSGQYVVDYENLAFVVYDRGVDGSTIYLWSFDQGSIINDRYYNVSEIMDYDDGDGTYYHFVLE